MKNIFWTIGLVFAPLLGAYALYATSYFAWLTATPLTESQLKRAQYDTYIWAIIFFASLAFTAIGLARIWRLSRKK